LNNYTHHEYILFLNFLVALLFGQLIVL